MARPRTIGQERFFRNLLRSSVYSEPERSERLQYWGQLSSDGARLFLDFIKTEFDRRKRERRDAEQAAVTAAPTDPFAELFR